MVAVLTDMVMTVDPGFGSQRYLVDMEHKIAAAGAETGCRSVDIELAADDGIGTRAVQRPRHHGRTHSPVMHRRNAKAGWVRSTRSGFLTTDGVRAANSGVPRRYRRPARGPWWRHPVMHHVLAVGR